MDFGSEYKRSLEIAMTVTHSSVNPAASDSTWEAYKSWMSSEISKMKDLGILWLKENFVLGSCP